MLILPKQPILYWFCPASFKENTHTHVDTLYLTLSLISAISLLQFPVVSVAAGVFLVSRTCL